MSYLLVEPRMELGMDCFEKTLLIQIEIAKELSAHFSADFTYGLVAGLESALKVYQAIQSQESPPKSV